MLEGELAVQQGDRIETARVGETILKRRGIFHAFWNPGTTQCPVSGGNCPGRLFRVLPGPRSSPRPARGHPISRALAALAGRYGVEFDFSSLPELLSRRELRLG